MACFAPRRGSGLCPELLSISKHLARTQRSIPSQPRRFLITPSKPPKSSTVPNFAFAFDIDGVLLRSSNPLPHAHKTLSHLQKLRIPFILLTNGGGKHESERVAELSDRLNVPLDTGMFVQSHTPFAQLVHATNPENPLSPPLKDKCILVTGGDGDKCRRVAESYGFNNVITPADLITASPSLWPFTSPQNYTSYARPLPFPIYDPHNSKSPEPRNCLQISAIFIFNDPRDWALDTQLILDLLLSRSGILGSLSPNNNQPHLKNRGYQQDNQPTLYFSNPDLWWASEYHLPRLGQGGFREAFEGIWDAVTGGKEKGVVLQKELFGKPYKATYEFAEKKLERHRNYLLGLKTGTATPVTGLKNVYMIGDNPASDILGANTHNTHNSPSGPHSHSSPKPNWHSILVRTGVYNDADAHNLEPASRPEMVVDGVWDAVTWALKREGVGENI